MALISCVPHISRAQELDLNHVIINFSRETFQGESKIWDVAQSNTGLIYAATNAGLFEYDGERWMFHQGGIGTNLRSVFCEDDKIYTSGYGGYGYWTYDDNLLLTYYPLFTQDVNKSSSTEEFWNIARVGEEILFQSKNQLHIYHSVSKETSAINAINGFDNLCITEDGRAYIRDINTGIFYYEEGRLIALTNTSELSSKISAIFSIDNELYCATSNAGIYHYNNNELELTDWQVNDKLRGGKVFCAKAHKEYGILIGTVRKGVFLCDFEGNIIKNYTKKNGIQGNTVLSIFVDKSHDIWFGIDGGLSYVQESSPIQKVTDKNGLMGSVYSTLKNGNNLLLASNQGLFELSPKENTYTFDVIDESQGQTWSIERIDETVFVGHHNGAFILDNGRLKQISSVNGAWKFIQSPKNKDLIIGGTYNGLSLFEKQGNTWRYSQEIKGFDESARFMAFDRYGYLWVAHPVKGYYRISLSETHSMCTEVKYFPTQTNTLEEPVYFAKVDGDLIFYNRTGFYQYNLMEEKFVPDNYLNSITEGNQVISNFKQIGEYFWMVSDNTLKCIERHGKEITLHNQQLNLLDNQLLGDFTTITDIHDNKVVIGLNDGSCIINTNKLNLKDTTPSLILRQVKKIGIKGAENVTMDEEKSIYLQNNYGNLRLLFASPSNLKYTYNIQYKITKYQEQWSDWNNNSQIDLIGLSAGQYVLEIRAKDKNNFYSSPLYFNVYVERPPSLSNLMIGLYIICLIGLVLALIFFVKQRTITKERKAKEAKEVQLQLQLEKLETKALQIEKEKMILEESQLKNELERINNELISTSMNNVKKNDLLSDLRQSVISINNISQNNKVISYSSKIASKIDKMLNNQEDWLTFELHFKNVHQGFFDRITQKHPELSPNDLKLCAYLRLNLSTKEIASLINISPRSVEVARYRLRQKLQLPTSENLIKYILEI